MAKREPDSDVLSKLLKENTFFSSFEPDDLVALSYWITAWSAPTGTVLMEEAHKQTVLTIVAQGQINVFKKVSGEDEHVKVAEIGPGNSIGEMGLLDDQPISATTIAAQDSILLILNIADFWKLVKKNPFLGNLMLIKIAQSISSRLRSTTSLLADMLSHKNRPH